MNYLINSAALLLAAFIGFSSHRASLCTVKAVAELLSSRRGFVLASFAKATLWVAMIYGTLLLFLPSASGTFQVYEPRGLVLLGGFLFGVGAAINGGCSLSTLQRLADGDLWMLLTLAGIGTGILAWSVADVSLGLTYAIHVPLIWPQLGGWAAVILTVLWMLAAWELVRLWRSRPRHLPLWQLPGVAAYRLSTAALVIGLSGATAGLARRFAGGIVMGFGAAAIPGGNDTLILTGIPTLSGWALGTYVALLLGVASVLVATRIFTGQSLHIECVSDMCVEKKL